MRNITFKTALMLLMIMTTSTIVKAQSVTNTTKDFNALLWVAIVVLLATLITYTRVCHQKKIDREEKAKLKQDIERNI